MSNDTNHYDVGVSPTIDRRQLLASSATMGAGVNTGCADRSGRERRVSQTDETGGHDHGGDHLGQSSPVERIDVHQLSGNRRDGETVYYHPEQPGPYGDLADAAKDVPPGGTLQLGYGTYDVTTEGRIALDHGILIRGAGWRRKPDWGNQDVPVDGTKLVNTGADKLGKPVVEFTGPGDGTARKPTVRDLAIETAGNRPAIRFEDIIRSLVADCFVRNVGSSPTGIEYSGGSYFARTVRTVVQDFVDYGINVDGEGYAYEFYSNHVRANEKAALRTVADRTIVVGGEYTGPTGIRFDPAPSIDGGLVVEPGLERNEIGVDIGSADSGRVNGVQCYHTTIRDHVKTGVRFGSTAINSKYVYPVLKSPTTIAEWSGGSRNCLLTTDPNTLQRGEYRAADGAIAPHVHVSGSAADGQIDGWQTDVPTTVDYGIDAGAPLFHDGREWRRTASEGYSV
jgi:hypothetical protein